jgi:hypothetical protein
LKKNEGEIKMKRIFQLLVCVALFTACSKDDDNKKGGGKNVKATDNTDYSACNNGSAPTSIEGAWQMSQASDNGVQFLYTMKINRGYTDIYLQCSQDGDTVTAHISSSSHYDSRQFVIERDAEKTEDNGMHKCSVSMQAATANYSFKGACLVLTNPNNSSETQTLIPAN